MAVKKKAERLKPLSMSIPVEDALRGAMETTASEEPKKQRKTKKKATGRNKRPRKK